MNTNLFHKYQYTLLEATQNLESLNQEIKGILSTLYSKYSIHGNHYA